MASTAHKSDEQKKQYFDSEEVLDKKIEKLASLIFYSKHFIAFTGAGISTACGIPDFRSGVNTVLKTGPGAWQKKAQKVPDKPNKNIVQMNKATPSFTHMTFVALQEAEFLKYLVSQNTDGLIMRSGFNPEKFAELHGNRYLEKCKKCGSQFLRDFRTRQSLKVHQHQTSRKCQKCNEILYDSIINFGQNLPQYQLQRSFEEAGKADLCLAMGSSLSVTPAADIPKQVGKKGKLVIVNLQSTPLDEFAQFRINGLCDDVMKRLARKMKLKVRNFILKRFINFKINQNKQYEFRGIDRRGIPFTFFKQVRLTSENGNKAETIQGQPYKFSTQKKGCLQIQFYKYLKQPNLTFLISNLKEGNVLIEYDPSVGQWTKREFVEIELPKQSYIKQIKKE